MQQMSIKSVFLLQAIFVMLLPGSSCYAKGNEKAYPEMKSLFQNELQKQHVYSAFFAVYSPSHSIDWKFVGGEFQNGQAVSADNPFYAASIGKTFTATAIALLTEQGKLHFDDRIDRYLPDSIINNLHVLEGQDHSSNLTIAQLLQHTSGLPDYFEGKTHDGSPNMMELIFADPSKRWEPISLIRFSKEKMQPLFAPGTSYNYTDTEYVLLGLVIEQTSGLPLPEFFRKHFFEPLEMNHTSMYLRSQPLAPTSKMAEFYVGDFDASQMTSLTADWAGGGLVSTAADLIKFQSALFSGEIVSAATLKTMQRWTPETKGMDYGFGLRKIAFDQLSPGMPHLEIIGHSGSTGSFMFYCPQLDAYLAGTLNQVEEAKNSIVFLMKILLQLEKEMAVCREK